MAPSELIRRQTSLSANVIAFCRFLRNEGFLIGPREEADALQSLLLSPAFEGPAALEMVLATTLVKSRDQAKKFPNLYRQFWKELEKAVDSKSKEVAEESPSRRAKDPANKPPKAPSFQSLKKWLHGNRSSDETELAAYSAQQGWGQKDFSSFRFEEMETFQSTIRQMARKISRLESLRFQKSKSKRDLSLRETLRKAMREGVDIRFFQYRKRKVKKVKLVLICDVSKSMELYSHFLIQFIYSFQQLYRRIHTFVFSTGLYEVSAYLREEDYEQALKKMKEEVGEWAGGTRIGECLMNFWEHSGRKILNKKTVVIILSDGWDTGDKEILARAMYEIHRHSAQLIWLNPLAGHPSFQPEVLGMKTAMPYIDTFASAHNWDSLKAVIHKIRARRQPKPIER